MEKMPVRVMVWIHDEVVMEADVEAGIDVVHDNGMRLEAGDPLMHGLMTDVPTFLRALADAIEADEPLT